MPLLEFWHPLVKHSEVEKVANYIIDMSGTTKDRNARLKGRDKRAASVEPS